MEILATSPEKTRSTYTLDHNELADALSILGGEIKALTPVTEANSEILPRQTKLTYLLFLIFAGIGVAWNQNLLQTGAAVVAAIISFAALAVAGLYFGWNGLRAWSFLRKAEDRLGLARSGYVFLVEKKEFEASRPLALPGMSSAAILFALVYLHGHGYDVANWIGDMAIFLVCAGVAITVNNLDLRNSLLPLKRLRTAEQLRDRLLERQSSSAADEEQTFSIPEDEYKHIARMERALINLDRQRAIKQSMKKSEKDLLPVQQTAEVLEKKSRLDPKMRLSVQAQIEELSTEPEPATAYDFGDGTWRLPVKDSSLEIKYVLDTGLKEIKVDDLVQSQRMQLRGRESQKANSDGADMIDLLNTNSPSDRLE